MCTGIKRCLGFHRVGFHSSVEVVCICFGFAFLCNAIGFEKIAPRSQPIRSVCKIYRSSLALHSFPRSASASTNFFEFDWFTLDCLCPWRPVRCAEGLICQPYLQSICTRRQEILKSKTNEPPKLLYSSGMRWTSAFWISKLWRCEWHKARMYLSRDF